MPYLYSHPPAANSHPIHRSEQKRGARLQESSQMQLGSFRTSSCFARKAALVLPRNTRLSCRDETEESMGAICAGWELTISLSLTGFGRTGSFWGTGMCA